MEKLYQYLSSIYRLIIVGLVIHLYVKGMGGAPFTDKDLMTVAIFGVYALGFIAVPHRKWGAYLDWFAVILLIQYFPSMPMLYFLIVVPFIHLVSLEANALDMIVFSGVLGVLYYLQTTSVMVAGFTGLAVFISFWLFSTKFKQIGILESVAFKERKNTEKIRRVLDQKNSQIQAVTKLFVHKKHLETIRTAEELIDQMVQSTIDFYDATYIKLYYYKSGAYVTMLEDGDRNVYTAPSDLSHDEGKRIIVKDECLRIPIFYEKQPWGVIAVYGKRSRIGEDGQRILFPFEESDYEILSLFMESVMARLMEIRLNDKLKKAALYDGLTGLPNRLHLEEEFSKRKKAYAQGGQSFTLLMLDIDRFKLFNDDFGHTVGDEALTTVAQVLKSSVDEKAGDMAGRWGGEEFMAYVMGGEHQGQKVAEQIRMNMEAYPFSYRTITVSVGGAVFGKDGHEFDLLMQKADEALYLSKDRGRNRVTFFEGGRGE